MGTDYACTDTPLRVPFLRQVAQVYTDNEIHSLANFCFVVPNKRSAVFLSKYFKESLIANNRTAALAPAIVTISDFISDLTDKVEISRIEMLFILYDVYSEIVKKHLSENDIATGKGLVDFNRFQFWGDILINDFGDVDRYLVDSDQLFRNIEGLKEISANYLTEEQINVIRKYWNEDFIPEPIKDFWNHIVHEDSQKQGKGKNIAGFVKLWQVMNEIYTDFRNRLEAMGCGYSGMIYREVAENLKMMSADDFCYNRYIFTGFSVLSKSEQSIFQSMQKMEIADFYWDYASPAMKINGNRASKFIAKCVKNFPSQYRVALDAVDAYPDITVFAVPSTFGQAKAIAPILKELYPERFKAIANSDVNSVLEKTAIVLPDENLVSPLLNAMPREISTINVTMGFSLNHTIVASLIKCIVSMQLRARELRSLDTFFFEDVISLLSHPLIRSRYASICDKIIAKINKERIFNVPANFFEKEEYKPLTPIFSIVKNLNDSDSVITYLDNLFAWLANVIQPGYEISISNYDVADDSEQTVEELPSTFLELQYINSYRAALSELRRLNDTYLKSGKIFLEDNTVFHLAERILGNQTIAYEGMSLKGLQIMGVLESRSLDFENVIITSMNERIFPRKHYAKTFIPEALRKGYGMASIEHQESIYAYYFYRLISRAKKVFLLYDARTSGLRAGDMSRYINQIKYQFPPEKVTFKTSQYLMASVNPEVLTIKKTPRIMRELQKFLIGATNKRYLSASSLNKYINCPVHFYLSVIERYTEENELRDYMDEGTYGTIVHDVAENMYKIFKTEGEPLCLTEDILNKLSTEKLIEEYVAKSIRKHYLKLPDGDTTPLTGDAAIYQKLMVRTLHKMFEREKEFSGIEFMSSEEDEKCALKVNENFTININYRIDRIDRMTTEEGEEARRIIDYKTGGDELSSGDISNLFNGKKNNIKAIFQLLLYCNAYAQNEGFNGPIQPLIYSLRKVSVEHFKPLSINGMPVMDYRDCNEEFLKLLGEMLDEMFNPEIPFTAKPDKNSNCKYCKFQEICSV